jgi:hypothetical protein
MCVAVDVHVPVKILRIWLMGEPDYQFGIGQMETTHDLVSPPNDLESSGFVPLMRVLVVVATDQSLSPRQTIQPERVAVAITEAHEIP